MAETNRPTWDQTFLALAKEVARRSKDPSTQVGAVIVGPDREVRSLGYNCFPRDVDDGAPGRLERPLKYRWLEHAERNAIYNAARVGIPLKGCGMFVSWLPCSDCARAIIQSGIANLVIEDLSIPERWREDFVTSLTMLREAQIGLYRPDDPHRLEPLDILWKGSEIRLPDGAVARIRSVVSDSDRWSRILVVETEDGRRLGMPFGDLEKMLVRSSG